MPINVIIHRRKNTPGICTRDDREWRRWDLNPQPRDYDALALPLSYLASGEYVTMGWFFCQKFSGASALPGGTLRIIRIEDLRANQAGLRDLQQLPGAGWGEARPPGIRPDA